MTDTIQSKRLKSGKKASQTPQSPRISDVIVEVFVNLEFMLENRLYESVNAPSGTKNGREFAEYAKNGLLIGEIGYILGSHSRADQAYKFWFDFLRDSLIRGGEVYREFIAGNSKRPNKSQIITNHCSRLARLEILEVKNMGIYKTRYGAGPNLYYSPQVLTRLRKSLKSAKADNCWSNGRVTLISSARLVEQGFPKHLVRSMMSDLDTVTRGIYLKYCREWYSTKNREPVDVERILADAEKRYGTFDGEGFEKWLKTQNDFLPRFPLIVMDPNPSALRLRRMNDTQFAIDSHPKKT